MTMCQAESPMHLPSSTNTPCVAKAAHMMSCNHVKQLHRRCYSAAGVSLSIYLCADWRSMLALRWWLNERSMLMRLLCSALGGATQPQNSSAQTPIQAYPLVQPWDSKGNHDRNTSLQLLLDRFQMTTRASTALEAR